MISGKTDYIWKDMGKIYVQQSKRKYLADGVTRVLLATMEFTLEAKSMICCAFEQEKLIGLSLTCQVG